jgi:hypothetical protein
MDTLAIIALFNMVLWGGAFAVLWWMTRAETTLTEELAMRLQRTARG